MIDFEWSIEKNEWLIRERKVSFEMCIVAMMSGNLLGIKKNVGKYAHQKIFVVWMNEYVYLVPFVKEGDKVFLKTIIPSRKEKKKIFE